jgi:hypothetical protein
MSTIYDGPCPEPTEAEKAVFYEKILPRLYDAMHRRFGRSRTQVILDHWHVSEVASAITQPFERGWARRVLTDLNEEFRQEQFENHMLLGEDEDSFRPWLLVPLREP